MDVNLQLSAFDCRDCNQRSETETMLIAQGRSNHDLIRHGWTDILQQVNPWTQKIQKSASRARGCTPVDVLVCQACQTLGMYSRQLPINASQDEISSEGECWPEEVPTEVTQCDMSSN